jgi:hypothetical protein
MRSTPQTDSRLDRIENMLEALTDHFNVPPKMKEKKG